MAKSSRRKRDPDPDDDLPMTEEQWEAMMKESDLRAARFGELLETLRDDPDADKKVAREMGYNELAEDLEEYDRAKAAGEIEERDPAEAIDPEIDEMLEEREAELEALPAYQAAMRVGEIVADALKPYLEGPDHDEDIGQLLSDAWIGMHIAAAKISGAHAMGYEDDTLCGAIVNIRRGLEGAGKGIAALKELRGKGVVPDQLIDELLPQMSEAVGVIEAHVAELREGVWWSK